MPEDQGQDKTAWVRSVLEQYEAPLVQYAARITGQLDLARDVVQDTFLRLCRQRRSEVDGHLPEWLFTVCRNRALDVRRKESRMTLLTETEIESRANHQAGPGEIVEQQEAASHVLRALDTLPKNQQEVIRLKFQHGLSYRQISGVTKLTVTNVGYLIHTGLKTLRAQLNGTKSDEAPAALRRVP